MGSSLADQNCEKCSSEDGPLREPEYVDYLEEIDTTVWKVVADHHLEGTSVFDDFRDCLSFTSEIGELADKQRHLPDIHLTPDRVQIEVWTRKIHGLHKTDFIMAARMDRACQKYTL